LHDHSAREPLPESIDASAIEQDRTLSRRRSLSCFARSIVGAMAFLLAVSLLAGFGGRPEA
jgi:hypothetical protein